MLIFKNDIYHRKDLGLMGLSKSPDEEYNQIFDPKRFIQAAFTEEKEIQDFFERQPREFWLQDAKLFYPNAYKIGALPLLCKLLDILRNGLEDPSAWRHMNTYHFCLTYDILKRFSFNYNLDSPQEKLRALPELKGKCIHQDLFFKDYFFNTVFLMDEDKYNNLTRKEKLSKGFDCPCQFGVINGLIPTPEEMELIKSTDYPYSILV